MNCSELFAAAFGGLPEVLASAPGRIEFIGNHTDYNGGRVLGAAIERSLQVAVRKRADSRIHLVSSTPDHPLESHLDNASGDVGWARYPLAVFRVLRAAGLQADHGFELAVAGNLPPGAGLSSSAALELATAFALSRLYAWEADRTTLAHLCRQAENEHVGVPCGILDQGVCAFGRANHLVAMDCYAETFSLIPAPADVSLWVFNTGVKHALVDSLYSKRHRECREAFRILKANGAEAPCLAKVPLPQLESAKDLLRGVLCKRARHVIEEDLRVDRVQQALAAGSSPAVGNLLKESHESSRLLFENSCPELDHLVNLLLKAPGIYGARLSGGGFGGAVMALADASFCAVAAADICMAYCQRFHYIPPFFHTGIAAGADVVSDCFV